MRVLGGFFYAVGCGVLISLLVFLFLFFWFVIVTGTNVVVVFVFVVAVVAVVVPRCYCFEYLGSTRGVAVNVEAASAPTHCLLSDFPSGDDHYLAGRWC